ncbi:hypothetical protein ACIPSA_49785 [Streptomyces sp. NPDC086549]|uniref:hypothetical protein n=1 Tax=Streptomyces sp. NPDC086549 TaxID=3365752 RepID=UPI0037F33DA6
MAHTFDELVEMQRAADEAHGRVLQLRDTHGLPTATSWSPQQTEAYDTAWQDWRARAGEVQAAVTAHAKEEGNLRFDVEAAVRTRARHPEPEPANA